jgi:segregation and condensation protein B
MTVQGESVALLVPSAQEQERMMEAILFASPGPLTTAQIAERLPQGSDVRGALDRLRRAYEGRGVNLVRAGATWAFRTAPDLRFLLTRDVADTRRLSRAGIETLAIVAYHGPVTRAEIEEMRGVSVSRGTLDQLIEMGWVRPGRRRDTPGRPGTFVITDAFLVHFGLESPTDLPSLADLRAAGFLGSRPRRACPWPSRSPRASAVSAEPTSPRRSDGVP